jgi:hypothetical protein
MGTIFLAGNAMRIFMGSLWKKLWIVFRDFQLKIGNFHLPIMGAF